MKKILNLFVAFLLSFCLLSACSLPDISSITSTSINQNSLTSISQNSQTSVSQSTQSSQIYSSDVNNVSEFTDQPYVIINNNVPYFSQEEKAVTKSFETYAPLDNLGRCGVTYACIGKDLMPTEERGDIGMIKPSGWHTVKYDCVSGKYLYNRCHLIGFQLTGENANESNLITGTRYLNIDGMLPFEDMVADYIKETNNHVLYRVTPIFKGDNLVAHGVLMEGYSVEDNGDGILYNVYCYNAQPQITIDYKTGESYLTATKPQTSSSQSQNSASANASSVSSIDSSSQNQSSITSIEVDSTLIDYVLNTNTKKFHLPTCSSAVSMKSENRKDVTTTRQDLINQGYSACGSCKP